MPHVATDNVSTPPAFTCSPFFPPFFLSIYSIHAMQSAAMVRRLHSNFPQFQPRPAVVRTGLAHIRAGVGQFNGAGVMFSNFLCAGEERLEYRSVIAPVFSRLWAVPESGRRLGCSGSKCCFR